MNGAVIDAVDVRLLAVPLPAYMHGSGYRSINVPFVTLRDSDGRAATGFCYSLDIGTQLVCDMVEKVIGPAIVGRTAAEWDAVADEVAAGTRRLGATVFTAALSAVDIAVWDLRGLTAATPIATLLGHAGGPVPFYGSGRGGHNFDVEELVLQSLSYVADGFAAVKLSVGALPPDADTARVRAVREALGPAVPMMVDASERLTLPEALALGRRLDEFGLVWFEEPLLAEDLDGYRILSTSLATPIATGEHIQQLEVFARYLRETAVGFLQPDAALGGGITRMVRVAALAEAHHRPLAWHSLADLHVHLAAAFGGTAYIEDFPILDGIIAEPLRPEGGLARPPRRPGHGIRWDHEAIERHTARRITVTRSATERHDGHELQSEGARR
ncbi:MAG TPA: mandelate racemase/muconate lactonizing enzyme family protein [Gryllotalpicola sp.]